MELGPGTKVTPNVELDRRLGWTMRPNRADGLETTNSRGIRSDREFTHERTPGTKRLIVLGDSFTYGLGVTNDATYSARLEAKIAELEVINMGVNGYGTDQQCLYWLREGRPYAPDAVLIGIYVPDFHRNGLSVRELPKPRFRVVANEIVLDDPRSGRPFEILERRVADCGSSLRLLDAMKYGRPVCHRASLSADSTASAPEFPK